MATATTSPILPGDYVYWMAGGPECGYRAQILTVYPQDNRDHHGLIKSDQSCDIRWYSRVSWSWRIARGVPRHKLFPEPPAITAALAIERAPKPERMAAAERRLARLAAEEVARERVKSGSDKPDIGRPLGSDPTVKPSRRVTSPASPVTSLASLTAAQLVAALTPAQLAALAQLASQRAEYKAS